MPLFCFLIFLVITEVFGYSVDFPSIGGIRLCPPYQPLNRFVEKILQYVRQTIKCLKSRLQVPLIGFCGGPFTVPRDMNQINHEWLEKLTVAYIEYLQMQIEAGVDEASDFYTFSLPHLKKIVDALRLTKVLVILFCRGSCRFAQALAELNPTAIIFDWEQPLASLPFQITIQGNLDPEIFRGPLPDLEENVKTILDSIHKQRGFIFNLGHGVLPDTPVENALATIKMIQSVS